MTESILDAIRDGDWNFEPQPIHEDRFESTKAMPGSVDKVNRLAERAREGLPLWHSADRRTYDDAE